MTTTTYQLAFHAPTSAMSPDVPIQVSSIRKSKWVDLHGLIACAESKLLKGNCLSISLLGRGSYNTVYKLVFLDGTEIAASVSNDEEEDFNVSAKRSEIATMLYIAEIGLYPEVPVPHIHAWDLTFTNPSCAPYVLMDVVKGCQINGVEGNTRGLWGLDTLQPEEQLSVINSMARIQAALSRPVAFKQIGSLSRSDEGDFAVSELFTLAGNCLGGPYSSISSMWHALLEREVLHALKSWDRLESDQLSTSLGEPDASPQQFSALLHLLSALIPHFVPPESYCALVLHHTDLALRNVLFDSNDPAKITGVLDWGGAQIVPLMLSASFPGDLHTDADDPCTRPDSHDEGWASVPHDWTSFGGSENWPKAYGDGDEPVDLTVRGAAMVRRYYLRQHYGASYAKHVAEMLGDHDLAHATLFADAPYYLKFHEVLCGGWKSWIEHENWIRETYWRLRLLNPKDGALLVGPNTYSETVVPLVCDLGFLESSHVDSSKEEEGNTYS